MRSKLERTRHNARWLSEITRPGPGEPAPGITAQNHTDPETSHPLFIGTSDRARSWIDCGSLASHISFT